MNKVIVKVESLPIRCEVCHQSDLFDAKHNYCSRCNKVVLTFNEELTPNKYNTQIFNTQSTFILRLKQVLSFITSLPIIYILVSLISTLINRPYNPNYNPNSCEAPPSIQVIAKIWLISISFFFIIRLWCYGFLANRTVFLAKINRAISLISSIVIITLSSIITFANLLVVILTVWPIIIMLVINKRDSKKLRLINYGKQI